MVRGHVRPIIGTFPPLLQSPQTKTRVAAIRIERLTLAHFRNYRRQEIALSSGVTVLHGDNAQGKSNLLEACYLLATTRPIRAATDRELVGWEAVREPLPFTRVAAAVRAASGTTDVEIVIQATETRDPSLDADAADSSQSDGPQHTAALSLQRSYRVNGVKRRAVDVVGQLKVVLFEPEDVELAGGPPALRRRYLDLTNSQLDRRYLRTLQQFNRIVTQRNSLLRQIRDGEANISQLRYWDEQLVQAGSVILEYRLVMLEALQAVAQRLHVRLAEQDAPLSLQYDSAVTELSPDLNQESLAGAYARALEARQPREIGAGQTLVGPHRDDIHFLLDGVDLGVYGSRGQRRTLALALKLAEAEYVRDKAGDAPVLLLDDVLSELDAHRRAHLLEALNGYEQTLITTTDLEPFPPDMLERASRIHVTRGQLDAANS